MGVDTPSRRAARLVCAGILVLIGVAFLAPLIWLVLSCFDASAQTNVKFPDHPSLDNFRAVMNTDMLWRPLWNGLLLCGGSALITVLIATFAAYPLSRYQTRFRKPFLYTVLFATGLPITAIMVPVYGLFVRLQLVDSMPATALFLATTSLPFAIWLIKGFIDSVPISLEEASWVDGASPMQALRHIVVPLIAPGMSVVLIFTFIQAWGNFFVPFILLQSPEKLPASVTVFTFFGQYGAVAYGQLAAYSVLYSMPVVVLYLIVSRTMGGAFRFAGAAKG
ncbi:carbohydrate ABC transporter permease [Catenulispora sp. NF23]|uniref:Carbohydrate ABC transporter permease n=1 Tax=Catenulispora pinistramenti TaxID=2705254 RepID=A0ABS5L3F4_9ACTN|nr:carbohydrate ABC transporter permease [Catenulispora pinistramenti]MBS2539832.1 carbohydrate ABC transporter permease [Catenulispora pinistramenti]MBS2552882.1 carbohydrate ABC transporter permease [Catenulispora pinistramenti]